MLPVGHLDAQVRPTGAGPEWWPRPADSFIGPARPGGRAAPPSSCTRRAKTGAKKTPGRGHRGQGRSGLLRVGKRWPRPTSPSPTTLKDTADARPAISSCTRRAKPCAWKSPQVNVDLGAPAGRLSIRPNLLIARVCLVVGVASPSVRTRPRRPGKKCLSAAYGLKGAGC